MKQSSGMLLLGLSSLLVACGGGGDAAAGGNATELSSLYQGLSTPAELSNANIGLFFENINDVAGNENFTLPSQRASVRSQVAARAVINEALYCYSGSARVSGNINDVTLTGTMTYSFDECDLDGDSSIYDGSYTVNLTRVDANTFSPIDGSTVYQAYRVSEGADYLEINGTVSEEGYGTCNYRSTSNLVTTSNNPDLTAMVQNLSLHRQCSSWASTTDEQMYLIDISGRIYLAEHGYVDVHTQDLETAIYAPSGHEYNGRADVFASGSLLLENEHSRFSLTNSIQPEQAPYIYRSHITLLDKDSEQQLADVELPAWMVNLSAMLDFNDSDADGMWDGYERVYGLDPYRDDSLDDLDADGFSNGLEFELFSSPASADFRPGAFLRVGVLGVPMSSLAGEPIWFDLELVATIEQSYAERVGEFSVLATLDSNISLQPGEWQVNSDYGCTISGNELRCDNLVATDWASPAAEETYARILANVTWTPSTPQWLCINFSYAGDYPMELESLGDCVGVY